MALSQAYVQGIGRNTILQKAKDTHRFIIERKEVATRGSIFTADGKPLATDDPIWQLSIQFRKVPDSAGFLTDLSAASGIPESVLTNFKLNSGNVVWPATVSDAQARAIQTVKEKWRADGVSIGIVQGRIYPLGSKAAAVTGKLQGDQPVSGLESKFNTVLSGKDGFRSGLVDKAGHFLPMLVNPDSIQATNGGDVVTTIDSELQNSAADAIRQAVELHQADRGAIVIMAPDSGDILAMANWPSYNPGGARPDEPQTKWSDLAATYMCRMEPGSMFKVLTLSDALQLGKVDDSFRYDCTGEMEVGKHARVRCAEENGTRAHGLVGLKDAIAKSCNICAAKWAMKIGDSAFIDFIKSLGLLDRTGIAMPGEVPGHINLNDANKLLQSADLGFGQSITVTPIALANALSMLGNNGVRMEPRLISRIGNTSFPPKAAQTVVSAQVANQVKGYMEAVMDTEEGTGHKLRIPGYEIAGKTGTAQISNSSSGYVSNFCGLVPADHPRALVLVMIQHPKAGGYYGADVSGPVFRQMCLALIRRFHIAPNQVATGEIANTSDGDKVGTKVTGAQGTQGSNVRNLAR